jgi:glycosyltransferase involved in cell wall biosynthesis
MLDDAATLPYLVRERQSLKMREAVKSAAAHRFDVALIEQIFMAPYREFIDAPTLLGEHGIESSRLGQAAEGPFRGLAPIRIADPRHEAIRLREYEDRIWREFPVRTATNQADQREIQRRAGSGETVLVENGTDPALRLPRAHPHTSNVLFFAAFDNYPDVDALLYLCEEIWPRARRLNPSLRLMVAGNHPPDAIQDLAAQCDFELIADGFDIRPIAARASLSIAPLRMRPATSMKVLDSMALGLPVIATTLGCASLSVEDGFHLLVRDDPVAFAEAIDHMLRDRQLWERLREQGLHLIEQRYGWDRVLDPLQRTLLDLAGIP